MKLSTLLVLFAATSACPVSIGIAQNKATPAQLAVIQASQAPDTASAQQPPADGVPEELKGKLQAMIDRADQAECPVKLTSAGLTPYLLLLRTSADAPAAQGGLDLQFRNNSGKEIRAMSLQAEFLAKKSIYELKATKIDLHLSANGTSSLDKTLDHLRHLPLPQRTNPVVLNTITLEQVTFADGSVWTPKRDSYCGFSPNGEVQVGAR